MSNTWATPVIWQPNRSDEEVEFELDAMIDRALATDAWLFGFLESADFLDLLHSQGIDVFDLVDGWDTGLTYL